jgi:hypothetical protein
MRFTEVFGVPGPTIQGYLRRKRSDPARVKFGAARAVNRFHAPVRPDAPSEDRGWPITVPHVLPRPEGGFSGPRSDPAQQALAKTILAGVSKGWDDIDRLQPTAREVSRHFR